MFVSLKYKLSIILVIVSISGLLMYAMMATQIFSKDKSNFVYDTAEVVAKSLSNQVRTELEVLQKILVPIETSIDPKKFNFTKV
jgi:sensor histidine kinase regulating citrate/malate metabolism